MPDRPALLLTVLVAALGLGGVVPGPGLAALAAQEPAPAPAPAPAAHVAAVLHVAAGSTAAAPDGSSVDQAFPTVQQAFDRVAPGDTVVIHPGLYHGTPVLRTAGTAQAPITVRADALAEDRVVLSAADPALRAGSVAWTCDDLTLGLWSAPFDHLPARLLYSGTDLLPYPTLDGLKTFTLLDGYPGTLHGFFFDAAAKKLYVRLHADGRYGSGDPNRHRMCAAPPNAGGFSGTFIHQPAHGNLLIDVAGAAHVVVEGLTCETPGAAGIITKGGAVTVRDCWFHGCRFGVFGVKNPAQVTVEHCEYQQVPAFDDMVEVIARHRGTPVQEKFPFYWWQRKGVHHDREVLKNYETGIAGGIGKGWRITGNDIHDAFEGLSTWGISDADGVEIAGNRFARLVDNAVETENHAKDVRIHHNDISDVFEPISWQPLGGLPWPGPVFVYRNRFHTSPACQGLWPVVPGCFKFGATGANWEKNAEMGKVPVAEPRARISKRFVVVPYPGFLVFNNTIQFGHGDLLSIPQPADRELVDFRFFNNVIVVDKLAERPEFKGSLIEFYNNAVAAGSDAERAALIAGPGGRVATGPDDLGLAPGDGIAPAAGGQLLGQGTLAFEEPDASVDLGAVSAGGTWTLDGCGPRVAKPPPANTP